MKLTNQEILNFLNYGIVNKKLPVRVGYAVSVNTEEFSSKVKAYEKQREILLEKYAEKDEKGKPAVEGAQYKIKDAENWNKDVKELLETETEVNVTTCTLDDLAKCDSSDFDSLTVLELSVLKFMIEK